MKTTLHMPVSYFRKPVTKETSAKYGLLLVITTGIHFVMGFILPRQLQAQSYTYIYLDRFNTNSYNNNDGIYNFSTPWTEITESNGVAAGNIRVAPITANGKLLMGTTTDDASWSNVEVRRTMDLSQLSYGVFSFDIQFDAGQGTGTVICDYSINGGSSWTTLVTYTKSGAGGIGTTPTAFSQTLAAPMKGSIVVIRFRSSGNNGSDPSGRAQIDNVRVDGYLLPVKLSGIFCETAGKNTVVSWTTLSEESLAYFEIESSINGTEFTPLSRVTPRGGMSEKTTYSYVHTNAFEANTVLFYRLKSVDIDGKYYYSAVCAARSRAASGLIRLYGNPVKESLRFTYSHSSPVAIPVTAQVVSSSGNIIATYTFYRSKETNQQLIELATHSIAPGIYTLNLTHEKQSAEAKFVKQ